jgi:hypothetical protein
MRFSLLIRTLAAILFISPASLAAATFSAQGITLTVTSTKSIVSFNGADVVGITNQLTGESYLRAPSSSPILNLILTQPSSQGLTPGNWTLINGGTAATLVATDPVRTVTVTVSVDSTTQEIVVNVDGRSSQAGVSNLAWGVTGFDMSKGKFILPAMSGISLTATSLATQSAYYFALSDSTQHWDAPLSLFQTAQGGVAVYSTDTQSLFKNLTVLQNQQQTANESFGVEAPGPWNSATEAGPIEWRLAAYQGDWQAGARIYRDWHNTTMPPVPLTGGRAWASNIRTVIEFEYPHPYDTSTIDSLAAVLNPAQTLLYLPNWRSDSYDVNYPNYTPDPSTQALVARAHQFGFHVMLHTDMIGVSPLNSDYAAVQQYQARDPLSLQLLGWLWNNSPSTPNRYAFINPASATYRQLFLSRVSGAIQSLQPDALHLDISDTPVNDGNGLIAGMNYNQGAAQLHKDLLAAFPNLVLGGEGENDVLAPFESFAQDLPWLSDSNPNFNQADTPPVPITAYVLPNVSPYWHLGVPNPNEGGFLALLEQNEGQAVLPTYSVNNFSGTNVPDYSDPDVARFMKVVRAFQTNNLQPAWDSNWNGAELLYTGANGTSATLTDSGTLLQFNLISQSGTNNLYQRVHGSNQITSSASVPKWPAYNGNLTLGLDPAFQYWLDPPSNNPGPVHITSLPSGVRLGVGTGTLVTSGFSYFQLLPGTTPPFDFFGGLWQAHVGTTYNGVDGPLVNGATAYLTTMTVGGASRQGIFAHPPYIGQQGGETFLEYRVPVPDGYAATLSFAGGILDGAIGLRQGPMTFRVEINGTVEWQQDISTGGWQAGTLDLSTFMLQTVTIRFVTNPGPANNSAYAWGGWSALQLSVTSKPALTDVVFSAPSSITASSIVVPGGSMNISSGTVSVAGIPLGGTSVVFTATPYAAGAGQTLMDIPFTKSQSSNGQLAGPSTVPYSGTIAATSAGGINKQRTIYGFTPLNGQFVLSWPLQLPSSSSLYLSFSTGLRDDAAPFNPNQDVLLYVRVNGIVLWSYRATLPSAWTYGEVDLSPWKGQSIVLELISDSDGPNGADWTSWAELTLDSAPTNGCGTALNPSGAISAASGGLNSMITVTTGSGCSWSTVSAANWISVTPTFGTASGTVGYSVNSNPGPPRQTTVAVAGHLIGVSQGGSVSCTYSAPMGQSFPATGGAGSANVTTPAGCYWSAQSNANWVTITLLTSSSVSYSVAANPNDVRRTATLTIAGQTVTVAQDAAPKKRRGQLISQDE